MNRDEIWELLAASDGDKYFFDGETTFIKEQTINVHSGANFYNGSQPKQKKKEQNPIILELMPICMDNEEYAAEFLAAVDNASALDITNAVKSFREKKKLDAQLCHHRLWKLLHDKGIYKLGERNWNERIKY